MKSVTPFAASSAWNGKTSSRTQFTSRSPFSACAQDDQRRNSRGTVPAPGSGALRGVAQVPFALEGTDVRGGARPLRRAYPSGVRRLVHVEVDQEA